jgi:hypothetical protein
MIAALTANSDGVPFYDPGVTHAPDTRTGPLGEVIEQRDAAGQPDDQRRYERQPFQGQRLVRTDSLTRWFPSFGRGPSTLVRPMPTEPNSGAAPTGTPVVQTYVPAQVGTYTYSDYLT